MADYHETRAARVCELCNLNVGKRSLYKPCSFKCGNLVHEQCLVNKFKNKSAKKNQKWICKVCQKQQGKSTSSHPQESITHDVDKGSAASANVCAQVDLTSLSDPSAISWNTMYTLMLDMKKSLEFLSAQYDTISQDTKQITTLLSEIKNLKETNKQLESKVTLLEQQNNKLEQYSKNYNLEVQGVPVTKNEDPYNIVVNICEKLGADVDIYDIEYCHRVPVSTPTTDPTVFSANQAKLQKTPRIIAKFYTRQKRDLILQKMKASGEQLTTAALGLQNGASTSSKQNVIYINEHLTAFNKNLFWLTRNFKKQHGFKYAWVKNGQVKLRKDDNSKIININGVKDFPNIN